MRTTEEFICLRCSYSCTNGRVFIDDIYYIFFALRIFTFIGVCVMSMEKHN